MTTNENANVSAENESDNTFKRVFLTKDELTDVERKQRAEMIDAYHAKVYPGLKPEQYAAMRAAMLGARVKPEAGGDPISVVGTYRNRKGLLALAMRSENEACRAKLPGDDGRGVFMSFCLSTTKPRATAEKRMTKPQAQMKLATEYMDLAIAGKRPALAMEAWVAQELHRYWQPAKKGEESAE